MAKPVHQQVAYLSLFGLVAAALTFGQSHTSTKPAHLSASAVIEQLRPSIVQVNATASEGWSMGSGFVVAGKYVVTNCHVVGLCRMKPLPLLTNPSVMVAFRIPNFATSLVHMKQSFRAEHVEIVDTDLVNDLTLLKLPDDIDARLRAGAYMGPEADKAPHMQIVSAKLSDAALNDGTDIFISGFPFREPSLVTQRGMIASAVERSNIPYFNEPDNDSDVILLDGMINHGNSGGPVYLAQTGEVVGVAEAFVGTENQVVPIPQPATPPALQQQPAPPSVAIANSGLAVAIPAKYVIALLTKNHIVSTGPTR